MSRFQKMKDATLGSKGNAMPSRDMILWAIDFSLYVIIATSMLFLSDEGIFPLWKRMLSIAVLMTFVFASRGVFNIYRQVWRYATGHEYLAVIWADFIGGLGYLLFSFLLSRWNMQIMVWQTITIVTVNCLVLLSSRFAYVCYHNAMKKSLFKGKADGGLGVRLRTAMKSCGIFASVFLPFSDKYKDGNIEVQGGVIEGGLLGAAVLNNKINIAIVGAKNLGVLLARELLSNPKAHYYPYCFVDSDVQKVGNMIAGIRVYPEEGIIERLRTMPVQEIIIALPHLNGQQKMAKYEFYRQSDCKVKLYDFPFNQNDSNEGKRMLREFSIEDLLAREVIQFGDEESKPVYHGKTILVTGGGGSIGSELCRQLIKMEPDTLIIFDIYENNAYDIEQELLPKLGKNVKLRTEIGSVRDEERLREVFEKYHPHIVFHAAAHKHVPMMEKNSAEAVKNNVFGTLTTVNLAEEYEVERFLLISTDKAVNPTNVMGASKRLCEMIVQSRHQSKTRFSSVRFGNVLGSNGSVITLFKKQIVAGGPVTLTDKRIIRYFMTIPEAAQLVLQTCALSRGGDIYVLDMGVPVRILTLAENMIRLSGLLPYKDIQIKEIGLRPGEKLYEELLVSKDSVTKTANDLIFVEREKPISMEEMDEKLDAIQQSLLTGSDDTIVQALHQVVPTYLRPEMVNNRAENSLEMKMSRIKSDKVPADDVHNVSGW